jgi:hypothetical protein
LAKRKPKPKPEGGTPGPPPPLILETTAHFDRDVKRQEKRGKSLEKLHAVVQSLRTHRNAARGPSPSGDGGMAALRILDKVID